MSQINITSTPEFVMVVGLPGSGKSTYIEKQYPTYCIHSSDAIREELSGDVNNQDINTQVFNTLHKRVKDDLAHGKNVVYDATNINWKRRKAFLQELNNINCWKTCILIATPFEVCCSRNKARERTVPDYVIERMYKSFDIPWYNEGWNDIKIIYTDSNFKNMYGHYLNFLNSTADFDQHSKWHTETLGVHCVKTARYVADNEAKLNNLIVDDVKTAAVLHDCGKPSVKTFKDSKGNVSEFAHYYNHENVGAYESLFYGKHDFIDSLLVAALIRWHMVPHFFKDWKQKTIDKYEKEFTENKYLQEIEFYNALKLLHEGDKKAH
jgi:predicted kinase